MVFMDNASGTIFKIRRFSLHDGPGIRTSVFLKGCPLQCIWCHSPEGISDKISLWYDQNSCIRCGECLMACPEKALSSKPVVDPFILIERNKCNLSGNCVHNCPTKALQFNGLTTDANSIVNEIEKDLCFFTGSGGGVTLTGGEPLYQPLFAASILQGCRKKDIHTAIETSLYCDKESLKLVDEYTDLFIIDLKLFNSEQHGKYTGKTNELILDNFEMLANNGKPVIVRIPLIRDITDQKENIDAILNFVKSFDRDIPVEYINFNPLAKNSYDRLGIPWLMEK